MVDVEAYGSSDLGGDRSDDEPPSLSSASPSDDDDPEDPDQPKDKKKKKKRKTRRRHSKDAKAVATSKIVVNLPEFTGKDLAEFAENFGRFLRMTGQTHASGRDKCDLLLQCCKTKYLEKQVKQIVTRSATFPEVLVALERQYPSYETDLSIGMEIQNLGMLPNNPKAARITELLADLDHWVGRLTPGSYGSDELLFWLVAKIPTSKPRRSGRQGPSPTRTCLSCSWSWRWRRRATSTRTPTVLEEEAQGAKAKGTRDPDLDRGLPPSTPVSWAMSRSSSGVTPEGRVG